LEITSHFSGFAVTRTEPPADYPSRGGTCLPAVRAARTVHNGRPQGLAGAYRTILDVID
jgi:hypothetical protein